LWLSLAFLWPAWAQEVHLTGTADGRALLSIDGSPPRFVGVGQTVMGVKLLQVDEGTAKVQVGNERLRLRLGEQPLAVSSSAKGTSRQIVLMSDAGGHFTAQGQINGRSVAFLVDTGATVITLSVAQARQIGLNHTHGQPVLAQTANGTIQGHQVLLSSVRVGHHTSTNVPAVVLPADIPYVLLGNSFLNQFNQRREGAIMTLTPRF
jgi:aspartyl protease family protein